MKYLNTLLIFGIIGYLLFCNEPSFGGVRGGARTGFHLIDGESIAISSSSPMYDFVISQDTATSTIMLTSDHASSSACIIMKDTDFAGFTYITALNGSLISSSTNICD
jgi:hypothetical protein